MYLSNSIAYNAAMAFSFVDLIPLLCLFLGPLSVVGHDSGRCFSTASAVRPGHVDNWLFFVALSNVAFGGQNKH